MKRVVYCCWLVLWLIMIVSCQSQHVLKEFSIEDWVHPEGSFLDDQLSNENLILLHAFELRIKDRNQLGGISSIDMNDDGTRLMAISDYSMRPDIPLPVRSRLFYFDLTYDKKGSVKSIKLSSTGSIYDFNDQILLGELESIGRYHGNYYGSLDNGRNRGDTLWQLEEINGKGFKLERPLPLLPFSKEYNREGIEALTELNDGRLWAIHERLPGKGEVSLRDSWIVNPTDGHVDYLQYQSSLEEVKGVCRSASGGYYVLEKTFARNTGENRFAIFHVNEDQLKGNLVKGVKLIEAGSKYLDNFEGISSFLRNGETYIVICSDNNGDWNLDKDGNPRQKTLLFIFRHIEN